MNTDNKNILSKFNEEIKNTSRNETDLITYIRSNIVEDRTLYSHVVSALIDYVSSETDHILTSEVMSDIQYIDIATAYYKMEFENESRSYVWDFLEENISFWECEDCNDNFTNAVDYETINDGDRTLCLHCYSNYYSCYECGYQIHEEDTYSSNGDYYCGDCYRSLEQDEEEINTLRIPHNNATSSYLIGSNEKGDIVKSKRIFSAEIEHYANGSQQAVDIYHSLIRKNYGICNDGSLDSEVYTDGIEVQTPLLKGKAGEDELSNTLKQLREAKCEIDKTCGTHIHIDTRDIIGHLELEKSGGEVDEAWVLDKNYSSMTMYNSISYTINGEPVVNNIEPEYNIYVHTESGLRFKADKVEDLPLKNYKLDYVSDILNFTAIKNLFALYVALENVIISFLPVTRRDNQYCRTYNKFLNSDNQDTFYQYKTEDILNCENLTDLIEYWYRKDIQDILNRGEIDKRYAESRYYGINMHSLFKDRNLEIRHHSATLNSQKILEWINLHTSIVDYAVSNQCTAEKILEINKMSINRKLQELFSICNLSEESQAYFKKRRNKFSKEKYSRMNECDWKIPDKKFPLIPSESNEGEELLISNKKQYICAG